MAATGTITLTYNVTGLPGGLTEAGSQTLTNASAVGGVSFLTLASGANSLVVPAGARFVLIIPPTGNTTNITLKGVTGDTGILLDMVNPTFLSIQATPPAIVLTAAATMTSPVTVLFF